MSNLVTRIAGADHMRVLELLDGRLSPVRWFGLVARARSLRARAPFDESLLEGVFAPSRAGSIRLVAYVPESVRSFGRLSEAQWGRAVILEALAARIVPANSMHDTEKAGLGTPYRPRTLAERLRAKGVLDVVAQHFERAPGASRATGSRALAPTESPSSAASAPSYERPVALGETNGDQS